MELRYPLLLVILLVAFICFLYFYKIKKREFNSGLKIANTKYIKESIYYKEKLKKYNLIKKFITISSIISILVSILMLSRPNIVVTKENTEYNRDIMLCMDVSGSMRSLNKEIAENLETTVKSLKGERFGITVFDSTAVLLMPLTDDYDYVLEVLDKIKLSIDTLEDKGLTREDDDYYYIMSYIYSGTQEGNGSSLIGDGLASCTYNFSNMDEDRTRIILFSTDNSLAGKPLITLDKATEISKNKKVLVYPIAPKNISERDSEGLKNTAKITGGKYYNQSSSSVKNIVDDINSTSKTALKGKIQTTKLDIPLIPFITLLVSFFIVIYLNKEVLK